MLQTVWGKKPKQTIHACAVFWYPKYCKYMQEYLTKLMNYLFSSMLNCMCIMICPIWHWWFFVLSSDCFYPRCWEATAEQTFWEVNLTSVFS